jgi:nucleotide-binding universal stress UspA family protein
MTEGAFPKWVALATDLSHRCDRALDRAVLIAQDWEAALLVVHAMERPAGEAMLSDRRGLPSWRRPPDPVAATREHLLRDLLNEDPGIDISVQVETGAPGPIILDAARRAGAGLIVTGVARNETLGRMLLGDTVDWLIRKSTMPILIVRDRCYMPYQHMVVATDFSASARIAFETAVRFFPEALISLFHAYEVPFAHYIDNTEIEREFAGHGAAAADRFLKEAGLTPEAARRVARLIERGSVEGLLGDHAQTSRRHLTVVGTHGGGVLHHALIGSTARKIIDTVPGDVLVVPDPAKRPPA